MNNNCKYCNCSNNLYKLVIIPFKRKTYFNEYICSTCIYISYIDNEIDTHIYKGHIAFVQYDDDITPATLCLNDIVINNTHYFLYNYNGIVKIQIRDPNIIAQTYISSTREYISNFYSSIDDTKFLNRALQLLAFGKIMLLNYKYDYNYNYDLIQKIISFVNGLFYMDYVNCIIPYIDFRYTLLRYHDKMCLINCSTCKKNYNIDNMFITCSYFKTRGEYYSNTNTVQIICINCMKKTSLSISSEYTFCLDDRTIVVSIPRINVKYVKEKKQEFIEKKDLVHIQ